MSHEVITFGCRLNIYESEVIKSLVADKDMPESIIFNSCAVTQEAERQLKKSIRKAKKEHPDKKIIVTGCASQIDPAKYTNMPEVDVVIGNHEKLKAETYNNIANSKIIMTDIMQIADTVPHLVSSFEGKARAFIEIQNGCDHRCTFCTIPYGRGNNRSTPIGDIVQNIKSLVINGYNEIVLTGVDITDYGTNLPDRPKLGALVRRILSNVPELERLRLSSIDVAEIDEELLELIINEPRLMPHLHISLQAGDNMILKRMKRRHNAEQVYEFCKNVRQKRPDIIFGADIIAGFPTENDEMFLNSYNLLKDNKIALLHVFPYSPRPGTPAARMPQVEKKIIKERAKKLRELGAELLSEQLQKLVSQEVSCLIESAEYARTDSFLKVKLSSNDWPVGSIQKLKIQSFENDYLIA